MAEQFFILRTPFGNAEMLALPYPGGVNLFTLGLPASDQRRTDEQCRWSSSFRAGLPEDRRLAGSGV